MLDPGYDSYHCSPHSQAPVRREPINTVTPTILILGSVITFILAKKSFSSCCFHFPKQTPIPTPTATRSAWRTPPSSSSSQPSNMDSWSQSDPNPPTAPSTTDSRPTSFRQRHSRHGSARSIAAKFSGSSGTDSSTQKLIASKSQTSAKMVSGSTGTELEAFRASTGRKSRASFSSGSVSEDSTDPFTKGTYYERSRLSDTSNSAIGTVVGLQNAGSSDAIRSSLASSNSYGPVHSTWIERTVSSSTERQPGSLPRVGRAVATESPLPRSQTLFGSQSHSVKR